MRSLDTSSADPSTPNPPSPGTTPPADTTWYFSDDGTLLAASPDEVPVGAVFRCVVQKLPDDASRTVSGTGPYNRLTLNLRFTWPILETTASTANPNLQVLHASIARY